MVPIDLNERWRVVLSDYDPPQWLLQRHDKGGWKPKSFCQKRATLLTAIDEKIVRGNIFYQGGVAMEVAPSALDAVRNLPDWAHMAR